MNGVDYIKERNKFKDKLLKFQGKELNRIVGKLGYNNRMLVEVHEPFLVMHDSQYYCMILIRDVTDKEDRDIQSYVLEDLKYVISYVFSEYRVEFKSVGVSKKLNLWHFQVNKK